MAEESNHEYQLLRARRERPRRRAALAPLRRNLKQRYGKPTAGRVADTNSRKSRRSVADDLVIFIAPFLWVGKLGAIEVEYEKPKGR